MYEIECATCKYHYIDGRSCSRIEDTEECLCTGDCKYIGTKRYTANNYSYWEPINEEEANVDHPKHYNSYPIEVIDMIESVLSAEQFRGYCLGNIIKYRMRAGLKDNLIEDIAKADWYLERLNNNEE